MSAICNKLAYVLATMLRDNENTVALMSAGADGPVVTANFTDMVGLLHAQYIVRVWARSQGFAICNDSNTQLQHPHSGIILEWDDDSGDSNQQNVTAQFAFRHQ